MKKRGEMQRLTLEAFRTCQAELGRAPTADEVFARMGEDVGKSLLNVRRTVTTLRQRGEIEPARSRRTRVETNASAPTGTRDLPPPQDVVAPAPVFHATAGALGATDTDDVIGVLVAKRDALVAKVNAINAAIEALR